jgi:hypothetical protein
VDRVRPRRAGVRQCVGVQRQQRRVEHRACHHVGRGMRRSRPRRRALRRTRSAGASVRRGPLCAAAPPMRARVRTLAGTRLRRGHGCRYGRAEGRFDTCTPIYIYVCVCAKFYVYTYMIHLYVHMRFGRGYVCVHQCAMGDGSAVCACDGGLVLRARPKTRNPEPCEPLPVGVDRVRLRRAGVLRCVGVQRQQRRVEHRVGHQFGLGMRRSRPRRRALRRDALGRASVRRGRLCAAAPPMRARVAHTCRHSLCAGAWV